MQQEWTASGGTTHVEDAGMDVTSLAPAAPSDHRGHFDRVGYQYSLHEKHCQPFYRACTGPVCRAVQGPTSPPPCSVFLLLFTPA